MTQPPLVSLEDLGFGHGPGQRLFDGLSLRIHDGECHCISGPTGSGKSSLLALIAGLNERPFVGVMVRQPEALVALVMQDPQVQLLRRTLGAEVAFGLENHGVAADDMPAAVKAALIRVGLELSLDTPIETLSLGQKYRVMLASQLVLNPRVLLLDEPWAQLDDEGVGQLMVTLARLKADGLALIIAEHHPAAFAGLLDFHWMLEQGRLQPAGARKASEARRADLFCRCNPSQSGGRKCLTLAPCELVLPTQNQRGRGSSGRKGFLSARFAPAPPEGRLLFRLDTPLVLRSGDIRLLLGDNGSGKSTLLKAIAGLQDGVKLPVKLDGRIPNTASGEVALMLQRPCRQLFELTVLEELSFSIRRRGLDEAQVAWVQEFLAIEHLAAVSPHKLSWGQQHLVLLAALVITEPRLLLLDDPFAGLDEQSLMACIKLLNWYLSRGGCCVLACHRDLAGFDNVARWQLGNGRLIEVEANEQAPVARGGAPTKQWELAAGGMAR
ncbi:ATP-binding cassette domain-containing protein [Shewanella sp. FJAT-52076]|uniref:ATP-binding cassette domain-containing protein n=1 Tax=Shewanella sp. FJAT-52076 TaxID=2864202 RepID=UPI001C654DD6|nr:ATP-binding cassette domain-containing protein [Shewanella sp. FJAT-52076]QYJ75550.1 ATP-binding cassette domain-containing protein [Shewanella sp. FJAT-52076]